MRWSITVTFSGPEQSIILSSSYREVYFVAIYFQLLVEAQERAVA